MENKSLENDWFDFMVWNSNFAAPPVYLILYQCYPGEDKTTNKTNKTLSS